MRAPAIRPRGEADCALPPMKEPLQSAIMDAGSVPMPGTGAAPVMAPATAAAAAASDPATWVDRYGDYLFSYAVMRLRDPVKAEDMVQETFLAALKAQDSFAGRSAEKSWLIGILKNKIIDHFRRLSRETSFTDLEFLKDEFGENYLPEGPYKDCWIHELGPMDWSDRPESSLDREAFWKVFHECAGKLPRNSAQVFLMREMDEASTEEICSSLNITPNNLWVMLHRARMALRRCLEANWFSRQSA
jgi:RNA polymerase sigma-70 factor (TIGR02943 family)